MFHNLVGADAEATAGAEGAGEGTDDHVHFGGVNVLMLSEAATGTAEDAEGPGFVEDEAELVAEFELDLGGVSYAFCLHIPGIQLVGSHGQ